MGTKVLLAAVAICLTPPMLYGGSPQVLSARYASTIIVSAPVRILPQAVRQPLTTLKPGTLVTVLETDGDWLQVEFNDPQYGRRVGYVLREHVESARDASTTPSRVAPAAVRPPTRATPPERPEVAAAGSTSLPSDKPPQTASPTQPTQAGESGRSRNSESASTTKLAEATQLPPAQPRVSGADASTASGTQSPGRRATVVTKLGETVSGALVATTAEGVTLALGGKELTFRYENISSLNFAGEATGAVAAAAASTPERGNAQTPLNEALKAFSELQAATQTGVLRTQYSEKLVHTLTRVKAFTDAPGTDWADVRLAMETAIHHYQKPLADLVDWKDASKSWALARPWVEYSGMLAGSDAPNHRESDAELPIELNQTVRGRLGIGDRQMPRELDRSSEGHLNDVYVLRLQSETTVVITMQSPFVSPHLTLLDASQRRIEADGGTPGDSTIRRKLSAGVYYIWAGSTSTFAFGGIVGTYSLTVRAQP